MAITDQTAPAPKGPSLIVQGAVLLVLTAAALGGGWFAGGYLEKSVAPKSETEEAAAPAEHGEEKAGGHGEEGAEGEGPVNPLLIPLAPMTMNLAAPTTVWVRMELALVLDAPQPPELIETIHQDLFAFMKTVKMHQIEGASGFRHFKADLDERARIRSDGHVKQVLVRAMLFE